ncbi:TPA: type II toxin-antitoxin system PemK/MazF family toxin, partial [Streptococcus pyogenes]|nr:type II toxin-antitoxin system PemK/MazF family toxin [Streptococcus pyogenes]
MSEETEEKLINLADWAYEKSNISLDFFNYKSDMLGWEYNTGEIYFCELGENIGNEINKKRPVLIISSTKY